MSDKALLAWIQEWMMENGYEMGDEGSEIYDQITFNLEEDN